MFWEDTCHDEVRVIASQDEQFLPIAVSDVHSHFLPWSYCELVRYHRLPVLPIGVLLAATALLPVILDVVLHARPEHTGCCSLVRLRRG